LRPHKKNKPGAAFAGAGPSSNHQGASTAGWSAPPEHQDIFAKFFVLKGDRFGHAFTQHLLAVMAMHLGWILWLDENATEYTVDLIFGEVCALF
jgi:hypothetical protein